MGGFAAAAGHPTLHLEGHGNRIRTDEDVGLTVGAQKAGGILSEGEIQGQVCYRAVCKCGLVDKLVVAAEVKDRGGRVGDRNIDRRDKRGLGVCAQVGGAQKRQRQQQRRARAKAGNFRASHKF